MIIATFGNAIIMVIVLFWASLYNYNANPHFELLLNNNVIIYSIYLYVDTKYNVLR